jgi:hypothetical protein
LRKLLNKTQKPAKLLIIAFFNHIGLEMHNFISKLPNLIKLFTEGLPASDEPKLRPVVLVLENPLILPKGQLGRSRDLCLAIRITLITGCPQGINVKNILNKPPNLVFDSS